MNRDPIEERGGVNLYGFVGNGAQNWIDNNGLASAAAHSGKGGRSRMSLTDAELRRNINNFSTGAAVAALLSAPVLPVSLPLGALALVTDIAADSAGNGDNDNDGVPDVQDEDDDNDGIPDQNDPEPYVPNHPEPNAHAGQHSIPNYNRTDLNCL